MKYSLFICLFSIACSLLCQANEVKQAQRTISGVDGFTTEEIRNWISPSHLQRFSEQGVLALLTLRFFPTEGKERYVQISVHWQSGCRATRTELQIQLTEAIARSKLAANTPPTKNDILRLARPEVKQYNISQNQVDRWLSNMWEAVSKFADRQTETPAARSSDGSINIPIHRPLYDFTYSDSKGRFLNLATTGLGPTAKENGGQHGGLDPIIAWMNQIDLEIK